MIGGLTYCCDNNYAVILYYKHVNHAQAAGGQWYVLSNYRVQGKSLIGLLVLQVVR